MALNTLEISRLRSAPLEMTANSCADLSIRTLVIDRPRSAGRIVLDGFPPDTAEWPCAVDRAQRSRNLCQRWRQELNERNRGRP